MEAKELKKLSRSELLEMLLDRSKEVEHLRKELDETKKHIQTLERENNIEAIFCGYEMDYWTKE